MSIAISVILGFVAGWNVGEYFEKRNPANAVAAGALFIAYILHLAIVT
ncbi:MAG: hypothetical protein LC687_07695 [Actinobacteria bacterium]|nr:hypothetical protein [Actinomycetota bacterium]